MKEKLQTPELEIYHHPEPCCQFVSIHHLHTAKELKASVQIQMPDLFFFVYREPFLPGTDTSVCETRGPGASFAFAAELLSSRHLRLRSVLRWDGERPLVVAAMRGPWGPRQWRPRGLLHDARLKCTTKEKFRLHQITDCSQ